MRKNISSTENSFGLHSRTFWDNGNVLLFFLGKVLLNISLLGEHLGGKPHPEVPRAHS